MIENSLSKVSVQPKTNTSTLPMDKIVTVYYTPHFLQITDVAKQISIPYKKIDKQSFVNIETGEVKHLSKNRENVRSISSLQKTFSRLSLLIKSNFYGDKSECFISLSYSKNISDNKEFNRDIKNFYAKLVRNSSVSYRCLAICEFQKSGNIHMHILARRLDNELLQIRELKRLSLWQHGTCHIQRLYDSEGLADYLNPFKIPHKRERLKYYKPNMQIYRCYGHFDRPQKLKTSVEDALRLVGLNNLKQYDNVSYDVLYNDKVVNSIKKIYYKEVVKHENI